LARIQSYFVHLLLSFEGVKQHPFAVAFDEVQFCIEKRTVT
jgi:hypothetical protein